MSVDGWRQAFRQKLQHVVSLRDLSDVLDIGWCHLHTVKVAVSETSQQRQRQRQRKKEHVSLLKSMPSVLSVQTVQKGVF